MARKEISLQLRERVLKLHKQGIPQRKIAERLIISKSSVNYIIQQWRKHNSVSVLPRSGRPKKTTPTTDRYIHKQILKNRRLSAVSVAKDLKESRLADVSAQTVRRRIHDIKLFGRVARKKPFICKRNQKKRLDFAKKYMNKPPAFWKNVLWSDESKKNLLHSDGRTIIWRRKDEEYSSDCITATIKSGQQNLLFWGCMASSGVGSLKFIEGIMDKYMYKDILNDHMLPSARNLIGRQYTFQHDNDPKHTATVVKEFLQKKKITVLEWPPQSPDLNPIEWLWFTLKDMVNARKPTSIPDLKNKLLDEWNSISTGVCEQLVDSMPKRLKAVIKARGGNTKY